MAKDDVKNASDDEKEQGRTGTPSKVSDSDQDKDVTERYTNDDNEISEGVRTLHPNRNVDKEDATGGGGYRN